MRIGSKVWKIFCGGQTKVTVIARRKGQKAVGRPHEEVRIQYPTGEKCWVSDNYLLPIKKAVRRVR